MDFFSDTNNLLLLLVAVISGVMLMVPGLSNGGAKQVSPSAAVQQMNQHQAILIDIRSAERYKGNHIAQARNIPAADLATKTEKIAKDKPIIVVCDTGRSAPRSVAVLKKQGFTDISILQGGMAEWGKANLPTKKS